MKSTLYFTLTLLTLAMFAFVPNSFGQDASPEYVVRVIYFIPNDRQPDPDMDTKLDTLIKEAQKFYADQMESHGFNRKTFRLETDASGEVVIHRVKGKFNEGFRLDNDVLAICPNAAATPLLSLDKYNRFTKNC